MGEYALTICGNAITGRTEVDILIKDANGASQEVARVYRAEGDWVVEVVDEAPDRSPDPDFDAAVARAKQLLEEYPDQHDEAPPPGLSAAGLSAWLLERKDRTRD